MSILVPIITTIIALIAIFFIWWILYPFLLRYIIDSRISSENLTNATNGNNGVNGSNGQNSPEAKHGVHGQAGIGTAGGAHGTHGIAGRQGEQGISGNEGEQGSDGEDGDNGIPGFNVIPVREHLFEPNSKTVYYVNGVSLDDHTSNLSSKANSNFEAERSRIISRIDNLITNTSDKLLFTNAANALSLSLITPDPDIHVLDTVVKFNNFLNLLTNAYISYRLTEENNKNISKAAIDAANIIIVDLRKKRDLDYKKLETTPFKLGVRTSIHNEIRTANPTLSTRFLTILTNLESDIGLTYDSQVRDLTIILAQQNRIFTSTSSSVTAADKNAAAQMISDITSEINLLKMAKEEIIIRQRSDQSLILERYDNGDSSGSNPHMLSLETYGTGANAQKIIVQDARDFVTTSAENRKQFMESFILSYRNAN